MTTAAPADTDHLVARVDELTARVETLVAAMEEERRIRASWADFRTDLAPVAATAMERSIEWFDETRIDPMAVVDLLARLAQAAPRLEKSVDTLVSVGELAGEAGDVGGVVFESMIGRLDDLGRRGYFTFAAGLMDVLDRIITSFGEEDLQLLGDNVVLILETVKEMTQPEVMRMLQRTVRIVQEGEEPEKLSLFGLLREMRDPEVKLGLHRALSLLRGLASAEAISEETMAREEART
ncbi:MAG: hypothetical protein A2Z12_05880 [Actinobacteria bacterium RBG_16_68_21]|nr:MAG: hypothetical protein A2Z12_05880 [Actinobacteria bacterium RBG_16_68_21]